jgi:hypothetical protein
VSARAGNALRWREMHENDAIRDVSQPEILGPGFREPSGRYRVTSLLLDQSLREIKGVKSADSQTTLAVSEG